ncbi:MAG: hypothetical protein EBT13_13375, partial [Rhodobacteraceae bacterium]|nr:hypothetical protein [Paracoccaceae bacterium]
QAARWHAKGALSDALKQERLSAQSALDTLAAAGIPDARPDVTTLLERAKAAQEHARSLAEQRTIVERSHASVETALAEHDRIGESSSALRGRADAARRVTRVRFPSGAPMTASN